MTAREPRRGSAIRTRGLGPAVLTALWAMLPAYLPNSAAVLVGGGRPIDGGRTWRGSRLLGDGKTWRGARGGVVAGALLALGLDRLRAALPVDLPGFPLRVAVSLPVGAMLGDLAGSFLKRRAGRERGAPAPVLDQLGFVAGAFALTRLVAPRWFRSTFTRAVVVAAVLVTPVLHVGTNALAYALGLKDVPW